MADFVIMHMYPDLMNLYGDRGNLLCLQKRLEWYGHKAIIKNITLDEEVDFSSADMIFMGGGSDREQGLVYKDLLGKADCMWKSITAGLPALCICGAYQLLGMSYRDYKGKIMDGLGFFDFYSQGEEERLIGNIVIETSLTGIVETVVGFENHGGRTYFNDSSLQPFGRVIKGYGNNGQDKQEGIAYQNLIGTYLHGPLLPKNPHIADLYIRRMAERKGISIERKLDDTIEKFAHQQVIGLKG